MPSWENRIETHSSTLTLDVTLSLSLSLTLTLTLTLPCMRHAPNGQVCERGIANITAAPLSFFRSFCHSFCPAGSICPGSDREDRSLAVKRLLSHCRLAGLPPDDTHADHAILSILYQVGHGAGLSFALEVT